MLDAWNLVSAPQPYDVRPLMKCPGIKYGHRDTDGIERKRVRSNSSFTGKFSSESRPSNFRQGEQTLGRRNGVPCMRVIENGVGVALVGDASLRHDRSNLYALDFWRSRSPHHPEGRARLTPVEPKSNRHSIWR
jgi:hypothetical protein